MKTLVIGYGSIGQRHSRLLTEMGHETAVLSSRDVDYPLLFQDYKSALAFEPHYVVIASETSRHFDDLTELEAAGFTGTVMVEKPLFDRAIPVAAFSFPIFVGYQLRFHPLVMAAKEAIAGQKIYTAHVYVGQHLSSWRLGRNPHETYSAHKSRGGGVLLDLSHELDLMQFLFGNILEDQAIGGRVADVTVDSDDAWSMALKCENCPVISLQMNYLDRQPCREMRIVMADKTIKLDFIHNLLEIGGKVQKLTSSKDEPYRLMHADILHRDRKLSAHFAEAKALQLVIDRHKRGS